MPEETQRPTREDIASLSDTVKITPLMRKAGLNPNTLRKVINGGQPRDLHEEEREALSEALTGLRDDIDAIL